MYLKIHSSRETDDAKILIKSVQSHNSNVLMIGKNKSLNVVLGKRFYCPIQEKLILPGNFMPYKF